MGREISRVSHDKKSPPLQEGLLRSFCIVLENFPGDIPHARVTALVQGIPVFPAPEIIFRKTGTLGVGEYLRKVIGGKIYNDRLAMIYGGGMYAQIKNVVFRKRPPLNGITAPWLGLKFGCNGNAAEKKNRKYPMRCTQEQGAQGRL